MIWIGFANKLQESGLKLYTRDAKGNALLSDSEFIYECQLFGRYSDGDHTLFVADVQKIHINQSQTHALYGKRTLHHHWRSKTNASLI